MEFIANQNEDVELGVYSLSYATEGGKSRMVGVEEPAVRNVASSETMESKRYKKK